jgi:magnesium chelatase family protein
MGPRGIRRWCALDDAGSRILRRAVTRLALSARAHDRVLKVARTIADLDGASPPSARTTLERRSNTVDWIAHGPADPSCCTDTPS